MQYDATFFALVGLIIFLAILGYYKIPSLAGRVLDERAVKIAAELDQARKLREEAQALLAEYEKKRKEAELEAKAILAAAEREAAALAAEAKQKTEEFVARRTALSEQKIKQAETDAIKAVKSAVVDLAISAAERELSKNVGANVQASLFKGSLQQVKANIN